MFKSSKLLLHDVDYDGNTDKEVDEDDGYDDDNGILMEMMMPGEVGPGRSRPLRKTHSWAPLTSHPASAQGEHYPQYHHKQRHHPLTSHPASAQALGPKVNIIVVVVVNTIIASFIIQ